MPATDLLALFVRPLNQLGWPYAVTGSVGSMFYAEPRFTNDIDVVVHIPAGGAPLLREAFPEPDFYRPSVDEISLVSRAAEECTDVAVEKWTTLGGI